MFLSNKDKSMSNALFKKSRKTDSTINNYFDRVYLINLKKRPDRLIKVLHRLRDLNIRVQVLDAINGKSDPYFSEYMKYRQAPLTSEEIKIGRKLISSPGAWGYLLTWKTILEDTIKNNYNRILSFDDDVIFIKNFNTRFNEWIEQIPCDWKILQLGATHKSHIKKEIHKNYFHPVLTNGSFATCLDNSIYKQLLDETIRMNSPFDSGPLREMYKKYTNKCFVAYPHLVIADVTDSDIRESRDLTKFAETKEWDLSLYDMDIQLDLISIVLVVRNKEKNILQILKSLIEQKYSKIEVIIVNDCSSDKTPLLIKNFIIIDCHYNYLDYTHSLL